MKLILQPQVERPPITSTVLLWKKNSRKTNGDFTVILMDNIVVTAIKHPFVPLHVVCG
jgi:hypothetical protein